MRRVLTCRVYFPDDDSGNAQNAYDHVAALMDHAVAAAVQVGEQMDGSFVRLHECYVDEDDGVTERCTTIDSRVIDDSGDSGSDGEVTAWAPDQTVEPGDEREYEGTIYTCLQGHTTQAGWEPPNAPSLWES